jgi:hypothetical protein
MKKFYLLFCLFFSLNVLADCRPQYQESLTQRMASLKKVNKIGKVTTGTAFITVGGFYGYMGVVLLGPLWAGAIVGGTFGSAVALPIGTTFFVVNKIKKAKIRKLGRMISILDGGDEFYLLHSDLKSYLPDLTLEELKMAVYELNESEALCDGRVARFGRFAGPKDLKRYLFTYWRTIALVH